MAQHASADGGLKVEADDGNDPRKGRDVLQDRGLRFLAECGHADEAGVVAEVAGECGLRPGLPRLAADAGDHRHRAPARCLMFPLGVSRQLEDRTVEAVGRIADLELRRMHADRQAAGAGIQIVAREGALVAFRETTIAVERKGVRRNDVSGKEMGA
jgi:hypothetical protein